MQTNINIFALKKVNGDYNFNSSRMALSGFYRSVKNNLLSNTGKNILLFLT